MRRLLVSLAAMAVLGMGAAATTALALPVGPNQIAAPTALVEAQNRTKAKRATSMRRSMRRGRRVSRGGDPNARNPDRSPAQQNTGQTSGGPRY